MDSDFELDFNDIRRAVTSAEVLSIFFPLVRKSLIIDTRCSFMEGPMVRLVPQAGSLEERYRSLQRMRPKFPKPGNLVAFPWPRYVSSLVQSGAVEWIRSRLEQSGYSQPLLALDKAIEEVRRRRGWRWQPQSWGSVTTPSGLGGSSLAWDEPLLEHV